MAPNFTAPAMVFPAYAGMILSIPMHFFYHISFPRVCGGDPNDSLITTVFDEFSPRMRG